MSDVLASDRTTISSQEQAGSKSPWAIPAEQIVQDLKTDAEKGLSQQEAQDRLAKSEPNKLVKERTITFWAVFREEVAEPMIMLLIVVGIVYGVWGELRDAITIFAVIVALVFAEVFTEYRAKRSITALRRLSPPTTAVLRDGAYLRIPAWQVVKGDVIPLESGDLVPADGRVIASFGLQTDESPLTGESAPVAKEDKVLTTEAAIADRTNMVFAGTTVTAGRGKGIITATGMNTELGRITGLVLEAKEPKTPLQKAMKQLAGFLVWAAVSVSVIIALIGFAQGKNYKDMILTALSLSFATIPEELPIIITMVLGMGALALSRRHVLIRRLRAAETLGGVTVIVTDKTGTITENKMKVVAQSPVVAGSTTLDNSLLKIGALTSHVKKAVDGSYTGDPVEVALLNAARDSGIVPEELQSQYRLVQEFSFDTRRKMMSIVYQQENRLFVFAKGAPESILEKCSYVAGDSGNHPRTNEDEKMVLRRAEDMAKEAMRVIALASKEMDNSGKPSQEETESGLVFLGLVGLLDPPRAGVADAIRQTKEAGIRTIMVSGDLPLTVQKIASEVGIDSTARVVTGPELARMSLDEVKVLVKDNSIFARINPEQKLQIVQSLQQQSEVVAVTGDGINDAPALKSADIGVAMGEKGTEAAREAAGMVLTDDSYNSIVDGVREGRKIYDNLRKGVRYYLSVKIALVLSFIVPLVLNLPLPFAPIQIIVLELFMDLAASATFVAEPLERDAMSRPPRSPKQKFVDRSMITGLSAGAVSLAVAVVFNYLFTYFSVRAEQANTVAFGTWLVGHIFLAFTMRSEREPLAKIGFFSNKLMLVWAAAAIVFFIIVSQFPVTQAALKLTSLDGQSWLMIVVVTAVAIFWQELWKLARKR